MLTGDKYDLFRPVCNRPEKKKEGDRQEEGGGSKEGWGFGSSRFVGQENRWRRGWRCSYLEGLTEALLETVCAAVSPVLEQFHGLPTTPSLTEALSFTYNLLPHISCISAPLLSLFICHRSAENRQSGPSGSLEGQV